MRTLLVDNYDSYTYNLYQLLAEVTGSLPVVVRNDDPDWDRLDPSGFHAAVISPGPGHPGSARDFGHSAAVLRRPELPVLGVCLGHQGIALAAGGRIRPAPRPRHGHLTRVRHTGDGIFAGLPRRFTAVRYHSLCVADPLPPELAAVAWAEDGVIMGIRHRHRPHWGVQFHPESICTEHGAQLLANFRDLAMGAAGKAGTAGGAGKAGSAARAPVGDRARRPARSPEVAGGPGSPTRVTTVPAPVTAHRPRRPSRLPALQACVLRIDREVDAESAFLVLHGASDRAFWLDSSHVAPGLSRFSFLGAADGRDGEVLTFRSGDESVTVESSGGRTRSERGDIFDALARRLGRPVAGAEHVPFDLTGGYVGYFGYELRPCSGSTRPRRSAVPAAVWLRADRFVAVDHLERRTYVVAVVDPASPDAAQPWIDRTARVLRGLPDRPVVGPPPPAAGGSIDVSRWLARPRQRYLADIAECKRHLVAGQSYEICLTNTLALPAPGDDLDYYRRLRRLNPAPYAALLRLGDQTVFCSSPERFLRIDAAGGVESKPIKGTAPRSTDPTLDEQLRRSLLDGGKTRAENLMIADLLRSDLGRVCVVGSIAVPAFMVAESYATVHQLVSTIRGTLCPEVTALDCVRACFPGGSMTGAPKLRTMEIIDLLEQTSRGVYSGTLGYLGFTGTADLNIVIRTAVRWRNELTVGTGGAIVLDSDPLAEYDEMLLKAETLVRALSECEGSQPERGQGECEGPGGIDTPRR